MDRSSGSQLDLPGFRFHPTEEELLDFYLSTVVNGKKLQFDVITTVNLYRYNPWELPGLAMIGEREWYFYVPRDRKQSNGGRPNRTTERGFWKATGSDRSIRCAADPKRLIGLKKTLVYYEGRAPRGTKTDWVMNEYRLPDGINPPIPKEDIVLCKIYRKATSLKELEQRAAMMEETRSSQNTGSPVDSVSYSEQESSQKLMAMEETGGLVEAMFAKEEEEEVVKKEVETTMSATAGELNRPVMSLTELEVPKYSGLEWMQDPFLTQLRSPWMEQWSPYYASVLNI